MKRMILMVVAVMTMTCSFAEEHAQHAMSAVKNVESYDMTIDMRRLAATLDLTSEQIEAVQTIHDSFSTEMMSASTTRGFQRHMMIGDAVSKDVRHMRHVLNDKQFQTYMKLLGATLKNRDLR